MHRKFVGAGETTEAWGEKKGKTSVSEEEGVDIPGVVYVLADKKEDFVGEAEKHDVV